MTAGGGDPGAPPSHSSIVLIEAACTSCMICARQCPSWCITIDSHTEPVQGLPAGARIRTQNVLDRFAIDWSVCMFCGICVEECPFDALEWAGDLVAPGETLAALTSQKADLAPPVREGVSRCGGGRRGDDEGAAEQHGDEQS